MKIHYKVYAFGPKGQRNATPFDSSLARPAPEDKKPNLTIAVPKPYTLMAGEVIGALDAGVLTMEVGEKAQFLAREKYAYGAFGIPGIVEPGKCYLKLHNCHEFISQVN
jgi:FKBP-type peptidyl-prolyl cis-trans isomerase